MTPCAAITQNPREIRVHLACKLTSPYSARSAHPAARALPDRHRRVSALVHAALRPITPYKIYASLEAPIVKSATPVPYCRASTGNLARTRETRKLPRVTCCAWKNRRSAVQPQKQLRVNTADLELGMYVARLDRPWTDTPFLFQGFFIRNQDEIEELQHHCEYVYIDFEQSHQDVTRTKTGITKESGTITQITSLQYAKPRATPGNRNRNRTVYVNSQPIEQELPVARTIYVEANRAVQGMISKLETDGRLDVQVARETVEPMVESVLRNPDAMIWLSRMRKHDTYMYHHSVGTSIWSITFGRQLGLDKSGLLEIGLGSMLLDVGKTKLPHALLMKATSLTETEWHVMRNHVDYSISLLEGASGITSRIMAMVHSHHERYDGSGYPDKLKGNQIPTFAKIAAMADCYDAITSPRPYGKLRTPYEAVREIYGWRGTLFQSEVVEQFMQVVGVFPTGSLVELNTGAVAVVIAQNEARRLKPKVMMILDEKKNRLAQFHSIDLLFDTHLKGTEQLWIEKCLEPGAYGLDPQELYL